MTFKRAGLVIALLLSGVEHAFATVDVGFNPQTKTVALGETFDVQIAIEPNGDPVVAVDASFNFDATTLQVVSITAGTALGTQLLNQHDNTAGTVDFSAGAVFGSTPPSAAFVLFTVKFGAQATGTSTLRWSLTRPRETKVAVSGQTGSQLGTTTDGTVTVTTAVNTPTLTPATALVDFQFAPSTSTPGLGQSFDVQVQVVSDGSGIAVDAFFNFDPTKLSVLSVTPGATFGRVLLSRYDNTAGTVDCSAGTSFGGTPPSGTITVCTVHFGTVGTGTTVLHWSFALPRKSGVYGTGGVDVLGTTTNGSVTVTGASIAVVPPQTTAPVGASFDVRVELTAGTTEVVSAQADFDFDASLLEVLSITQGTALGTVLLNRFNNAGGAGTGTVDYAGLTAFGTTPPSGTFTLCTIRFGTLKIGTGSLHFQFTPPRKTDIATHAGVSVLGTTTDGSVTVTGPEPTRTATPGPGDCCQCDLPTCGPPIGGQCAAGCSPVFGAVCSPDGTCRAPSPTRTATPLVSAGPTRTPTLSSTATGSPSASATPIGTPSPSASATTTATPSPAPTASATASATPSAPSTRSATVTQTPTVSATASVPATASATSTPLASASGTVTPTLSGTPSAAPSASGTPTPTASVTEPATPTVTLIITPCAGDCGDDGNVTADDIVIMVNIALGLGPADACPAGDLNGDGGITVEEVIRAVNAALDGCEATSAKLPGASARQWAPAVAVWYKRAHGEAG